MDSGQMMLNENSQSSNNYNSKKTPSKAVFIVTTDKSNSAGEGNHQDSQLGFMK